MSIRLTGMASGLDTDTMVQELVKASSSKKESLEKSQTSLGWKQTAWSDLNTKIYSFFSKSLSNIKLEGSFKKKATAVADSSIAKVVAGDSAVNGTQSLTVKNLATAGYLTGGTVAKTDATKATTSTTISELTTLAAGETAKLKVTVGGVDKEIELSGSSTMADVVSKLNTAGVTASFDSTNQKLFVNSKSSGLANDFAISTVDSDLNSATVLDGLKLSTTSGAIKINGQDAAITLNGADYSSSNNTFTVNGLTITAQKISEKDTNGDYVGTTINTTDDIDGIYKMVKDFFNEYNKLIIEMDTLYNASSSKGYEPLTDDEKESMSDTEVEQWETKIKDALLRKDSSLNSVVTGMKNSMMQSIEVDGKQTSLTTFGIETMSYFLAADNEKGAYHIDGNADDSTSSGNTDKLKTAIASNPTQVASFFTQLATSLYDNLNTQMKSTAYRTVYKVYDDKKIQKEYDDYDDKIAEQEEKLTALEDKYYKQFSVMESAMTKLNSQQSALTSMLGG